jgi:meiotic recombination protein SPO11
MPKGSSSPVVKKSPARAKGKASASGSSSSSSASSSSSSASKDPLAPVRALQKRYRRVHAAAEDAAVRAAALADRQLMEVAAMDEAAVGRAIERIVAGAVESILAGKGYGFTMPSRAEANQLYIPELDRIVLKDKMTSRMFGSASGVRKTAITTRILQLIHELTLKGIHVTKRDLFYTDVKLFTKQAESDTVLDDVSCLVGCTRSSLNVVASEKGVVVGRLRFRDAGDLIDCTKMGVGGKAIPPFTDRVTDIEGDAEFVLLVEKDAAFMRLAEDRFYNRYPCVIITAKGQPDVATRVFLRRVKETLKIPVLALMDADPYGLKILSVYMSGSKNMSYDSASLTTSDIKWLGVRPSDLDKYNIPAQCRLEMSEQDIKMGNELLNEDFILKNEAWTRELRLMLKRKEKAEIQALSNFGFQYLSEVYLPQKIENGDWI